MSAPTTMPSLPAEIVPLLRMPPDKVATLSIAVPLGEGSSRPLILPPAKIPSSLAEILPVLVMPPEMVATSTVARLKLPAIMRPPAKMPIPPLPLAVIVPPFVTPPVKVSNSTVPVSKFLPESWPPAKIPTPPLPPTEIALLLVMPPAKVDQFNRCPHEAFGVNSGSGEDAVSACRDCAGINNSAGESAAVSKINADSARRKRTGVADAAEEGRGVFHFDGSMAAGDDLARGADCNAAGKDAVAVEEYAAAARCDRAAVDDAAGKGRDGFDPNAGARQPKPCRYW